MVQQWHDKARMPEFRGYELLRQNISNDLSALQFEKTVTFGLAKFPRVFLHHWQKQNKDNLFIEKTLNFVVMKQQMTGQIGRSVNAPFAN